jgi:hypothetical protein
MTILYCLFMSACEFGAARKDTHIYGAFVQVVRMELLAARSVILQLWLASIGILEHLHHVARKYHSLLLPAEPVDLSA